MNERFTGIPLETYTEELPLRVASDAIASHESYVLRALLQTARGERAGEFELRTQSFQREIGHASLIACLWDPAENDSFMVLENSVNEGILTPYGRASAHITHPESGSLGMFKEGYLLEHPKVPAELGSQALRSLTEGATRSDTDTLREYLDTRTSAFERQGILLGYN